jgi:hypothetical protein
VLGTSSSGAFQQVLVPQWCKSRPCGRLAHRMGVAASIGCDSKGLDGTEVADVSRQDSPGSLHPRHVLGNLYHSPAHSRLLTTGRDQMRRSPGWSERLG